MVNRSEVIDDVRPEAEGRRFRSVTSRKESLFDRGIVRYPAKRGTGKKGENRFLSSRAANRLIRFAFGMRV